MDEMRRKFNRLQKTREQIPRTAKDTLKEKHTQKGKNCHMTTNKTLENLPGGSKKGLKTP